MDEILGKELITMEEYLLYNESTIWLASLIATDSDRQFIYLQETLGEDQRQKKKVERKS